jgi:hypothetical protein
MPNNKKTYIVAVLAFLWCFGIIAVYYVSHKPFTPDLAASVVLAGWRIVVGFAWLLWQVVSAISFTGMKHFIRWRSWPCRWHSVRVFWRWFSCW